MAVKPCPLCKVVFAAALALTPIPSQLPSFATASYVVVTGVVSAG